MQKQKECYLCLGDSSKSQINCDWGIYYTKTSIDENRPP